MPEFHVTWETVLEADDHEDAARRALAMQRDPESIALVFEVSCPVTLNAGIPATDGRTIDLLEEV